MPTLRKDLRNDLEKAVVKARDLAEQAATTALQALAVDQPKSFPHMDADARALRNRLRERGRAAGDVRDAFSNNQTLGHLSQLVGYEHWHRMIFARFLAENGLLLEPEQQVALSLEDVKELASEENMDLWQLAGSYAQRMLPGVFRNDDAALEVTLAREDRTKLEKLLSDLDSAVFTADDTLGWTYQFWQTKRKKEVNESGVKIGTDEISPVTQLFTEDYMVEFLLHNTLGAWWAGKLGPIVAASEEEARAMAALPERDGIGINWNYLRFIQDEETQRWTPAAGTFEGWPRAAKDVTFLDPSMGSGHFPVFALPILARLRMEEETLSAKDAVFAVLRDNLHGLELDPRCTQIGAFNLALTAWKLSGYQMLPTLHIACCGLAPQAKKDDWLKLAGDNDKLRRGMERLYQLFEQAPILGSLINPRSSADGNLIEASFDELAPLLEKALADEKADDAVHEMAVTAQGIAKAAEILGGMFTLVATNVPYLTRGKQNEVLMKYCERVHPNAKADLATSFMERCLDFCSGGGTTVLVTPQNWLFLNSYQIFRTGMLEAHTVNMIAKLGANAFEMVNGWVVNIALSALSRKGPTEKQIMCGLDVGGAATPRKKAEAIVATDIFTIKQVRQLENPDAVIALEHITKGKLLKELAESSHGQGTFDSPRFNFAFAELAELTNGWVAQQSTPAVAQCFGGCFYALRWEDGAGDLAELMATKEKEGYSSGKWKAGVNQWGKLGVIVGQMGDMPCSFYLGQAFDENASAVIPQQSEHLAALWCFSLSDEFRSSLRAIDQSLKITCKTLVKIPFDLAHWQQVAAEKYPDGLPKPHSDDATQWLFNGHPKGSEQPLQVAVARLLGYRWPRQTGSSFPDCPELGPDGLESFADEDGIVCLTPLRGEAKAADRLRKLLDAALGGWNERQLLSDAGSTKTKLEDWLRDEFFEQHTKLVHQRPSIWHIWDGRPDGFHALVNYHQLAAPDGAGHKLLESLTYAYLNDWIRRQKDDAANGVPGAEDRHLAADILQQELKHILAGEPPYDLFVRWKPLHQQPIGWHPDLNDGVRLNIRPFLQARDVKKKDAGILRWRPNVKWTKDRGTEPQRPKSDFPWFWTWDEKTEDFQGSAKFDGNRWNDLHYTNEAKQAARVRKKTEA
jgi:N-6 DNA Methylase